MCVVCVCVLACVQRPERTCVYLFFDGVPSEGKEQTERMLLVWHQLGRCDIPALAPHNLLHKLHATCNMQRATFTLAACNLQHATCNLPLSH